MDDALRGFQASKRAFPVRRLNKSVFCMGFSDESTKNPCKETYFGAPLHETHV